MAAPVKAYTFVDGKTAGGLVTAARLNGDFDPLYACLDPAVGGLEDTNVKAAAKIVCTDRAHTVTGVWTFTTAPVLPAASIADASLSTNIMKRSVYDTNLDGVVDAAVEADTLDGNHAAAFAVAAKGVTGGDAHDHIGGDGAAITEGALSLSDVTTKDVSTSAHGLCPKAPNDTAKFLRGDATWAASGGVALTVVGGLIPNTSDGFTYYLGSIYEANLGTTVAYQRMYCPRAGTIKAAYIFWRAGTAGTGENVSMYIRLNNTSDTLIATVGDTEAIKVFSKTDLSIAVAQGDYIEIKMVSPTWATNPANVYLGGVVYIE